MADKMQNLVTFTEIMSLYKHWQKNHAVLKWNFRLTVFSVHAWRCAIARMYTAHSLTRAHASMHVLFTVQCALRVIAYEPACSLNNTAIIYRYLALAQNVAFRIIYY